MEEKEIRRALAPCGLDCTRCADYEKGEIRTLSLRLGELLGNYARVAKIKQDARSEFKNYEHFEEILKSFGKGACGGCRAEKVNCPIDCKAKTCHKEKGVDFCFECNEYPCENATFSPLIERLIMRNDRMKEIGVIQFWEEQKKIPRYC